MVIGNDSSFDPAQHVFFRHFSGQYLSSFLSQGERIKQSKTDPFRIGVNMIIGHTKGLLCPVAAILSYMARKGLGQAHCSILRMVGH